MLNFEDDLHRLLEHQYKSTPAGNQCYGVKNKANIILGTYPNIDLFYFQEHWISSEECSIFNTNNNNF